MNKNIKIIRAYWNNGQLWYETKYHKGLKHGIETGWYPSGQLWYMHPYFLGQIHGISKGWGSNGLPTYEMRYLYGEKIKQTLDTHK